MRGIGVTILRPDGYDRWGDCTNGGVTSRSRSEGKYFVLFDEALPEGNYTLEQAMTNPDIVPLRVVRRRLGGGEYLHVEPWERCPEGHCGYMAGGNFAYSSDSRFSALCDYPLSVHDRSEAPEFYRSMD
jgi:hypothetical protein